MSSRSLSDLHKALQPLAGNHIKRCALRGITLLIYCTYRPNAGQDALYEIGRSLPGDIVTNRRGGMSDHNHVDEAGRPASRAYDCVPMIHSKPMWDTKHHSWTIVGECGEDVGLVWSGRWKGKLREMAHFALPKNVK